jgi:bacterioferritin-associated ferredoxin
MIVCLCHGINEKKIKEVIQTHAVKTVLEVQKCCGAGGDCGSCISEVKKILEAHKSMAHTTAHPPKRA